MTEAQVIPSTPEPGTVLGTAWARLGDGPAGPEWQHVHGDIRTFRCYTADEPVLVELVADPEGQLMGWLDADGGGPVMVQHPRVFNIQFAYGYRIEEEHGKGLAVLLSARPAPESPTRRKGDAAQEDGTREGKAGTR